MIRKPAVFVILLITFSVSLSSAKDKSITSCPGWTQVNDGAFGLGTGADSSYTSEEAFELTVFNDQLYVGMEADNSMGARLWRTKSGISVPSNQDDWEEIIADSSGKPFGIDNAEQNDHIDSLIEYKNYIYASTANRGITTHGILVFRSPNGNTGTWENTLSEIGPGFGDINNTNFKDMLVFSVDQVDWLCGGTQNITSGAQVWCTKSGTDWFQRNSSGFGNPDNTLITSSGIFNNSMYFGVDNGNGASVWRSSDLVNWQQVYQSTTHPSVEILGSFGGYLYIAEGASDGRYNNDVSMRILRSNSGNLDSWELTGSQINQNTNNSRSIVDGAVVYLNNLYLSTMNTTDGSELWRTNGSTWVHLSNECDGFGDSETFAVQLLSFNGHLYAWTSNYTSGQKVFRKDDPSATYVFLMIGDGMGAKHIEAARNYSGKSANFESWSQYWISTYPDGGDYDSNSAWADFSYVKSGTTDSAAAATALFTGEKTSNGRISVSADGNSRLQSITEKSRGLSRSVGAVTSVYISHATPGAWYAHNDSRYNGFAIADEGLWGDPNTTGVYTQTSYSGGHGTTAPPIDVLIGAGHPNPVWGYGGTYVNDNILNKLIIDSNNSQAFSFLERIQSNKNAGKRLLDEAGIISVRRLVGLFGGTAGNLEYQLANGSGYNPENPTLEEMTSAAITVLERNPNGFTLMVEGGAIDWASHSDNMDKMIGEFNDFNRSIDTVIDWIENESNSSNWSNSLIIVTGDHETGYLTAGPGIFPNEQLGEISANTIDLEKEYNDTGLRASWNDTDSDNIIDSGETVYWAWNSSGHTNSLIPLYAKGTGADLFGYFPGNSDQIRGTYLDNTNVFDVMDYIIYDTDSPGLNYHHQYFPLILIK